jgi:nucleoside 2-deoxyribosyltransferase
MKIYVASSWRNQKQPSVVDALRKAGHEVYDFKNPPGRTGFSWQQTGASELRGAPFAEYVKALIHPAAQAGFQSDMDALQSCDACVLVLPCGRSAHLELGYAVGAGKPTFVLAEEIVDEPELMYLMCSNVVTSLGTLLDLLDTESDRLSAE